MKKIKCKVSSEDCIKVNDVSFGDRLVDIGVVQKGSQNTVALDLKGVKKLRKFLKRAQKELEELECD